MCDTTTTMSLTESPTGDHPSAFNLSSGTQVDINQSKHTLHSYALKTQRQKNLLPEIQQFNKIRTLSSDLRDPQKTTVEHHTCFFMTTANLISKHETNTKFWSRCSRIRHTYVYLLSLLTKPNHSEYGNIGRLKSSCSPQQGRNKLLTGNDR